MIQKPEYVIYNKDLAMKNAILTNQQKLEKGSYRISSDKEKITIILEISVPKVILNF